MKQLIEKLRSEKGSIEMKMTDHQSESNIDAFRTGKRIAKIWINAASYQEIKDVIKRPNPKYDANYFSLMRNVYFTSLERICPEEALRYKWTNNDSFVHGWREEVNRIWDSIKDDVDR